MAEATISTGKPSKKGGKQLPKAMAAKNKASQKAKRRQAKR